MDIKTSGRVCGHLKNIYVTECYLLQANILKETDKETEKCISTRGLVTPVQLPNLRRTVKTEEHS
jgi:hypothetical protein